MRWMTRARHARATAVAGAAPDASGTPETDDPIALEIQAHIDAVAAELEQSGLSPPPRATRRCGASATWSACVRGASASRRSGAHASAASGRSRG